MRRAVVTAIGVLTLALVCSAAVQLHAQSSVFSAVTVRTLAKGQVKALPAGKVFINILEFRQQPGADFGPHSHQASIVYTLQGVDTISFQTGSSQSVGPGAAAFIPALVKHSHQNPDGRIGAAAIAVGLVVVVILLCAATWLRGGRRRITITVLSILLIAGGALPLTGATSNDYYLIAVRPDAQRALSMPRPDGRVAYTAPDMDPVPAGPYVEALTAITVPAGARYVTPDIPGPQMIVVVGGSATVQLGDQTSQLVGGGGAFAQMAQTLTIVNSGSDTLQVLDFAVTSATASLPAA
jgi:quercetin dioxygenase-like cupin family protein